LIIFFPSAWVNITHKDLGAKNKGENVAKGQSEREYEREIKGGGKLY